MSTSFKRELAAKNKIAAAANPTLMREAEQLGAVAYANGLQAAAQDPDFTPVLKRAIAVNATIAALDAYNRGRTNAHLKAVGLV
jgi:hypothetical protein